MNRRQQLSARTVTGGVFALFGIAACASTAMPRKVVDAPVAESQVRAVMSVLADDSLEGRMTGSRGSAKAATFIAQQMGAVGLVAAGDSGFFQRVPIALTRRSNGQERLTLVTDFAALDKFPADQRRPGVNVVGMIRGSDTVLAKEVVLVDAHYDHLGIGKPVNGDSIYNGADDDASGTTAVVEIARSIAAGPPPKRTILFVATTGEEVGLLGTRWFIEHPPVSLRSIVSNLEIEMIGRPDSLAGGRGRAWLTGYERSTMGAMFTAAGLPIVPDARPTQHFFERSDNIAYAQMGIPAHTLSTFNLHTDYHRPSDELSRIDFNHMTRVIQAGVQAVRILADGPAPRWNAGGRPAPR
ncbi:MAG: M20/M25/M40 family metallo-hydrolase [Gemmatimonadaceae bacterium]